MLHVFGVQNFVPHESVESAGSGHHDVGALGLVPEEFGVLRDGSSTEEGRDADVGHVLGESRVLVLYLEGELASVAEDDDGDLAVHRLELLESRQDEHGGLTVTRLGLAQNIHSEHGLRDTFLLDCGRIGVRTLAKRCETTNSGPLREHCTQ